MSISFGGNEGLLWTDLLSDTSPPYTITAWCKPSTVAEIGTVAVVYANSNGNNAYALRVSPTPRVQALTRGFGTIRGEAENVNTDVVTGAWQHMAAVFPADQTRAAFLAGADKGTDSNTGSVALTPHVGIGYLTFIYGVSGLVAEVAIWNTVLSDQDIAFLATGVLPETVSSSNLVFLCTGRESLTAEVGGAATTTLGPPSWNSDHPTLLTGPSLAVLLSVIDDQ